MIEETGIVTTCQGEFAEVQTQRSSACGACASKGACGTSVLSQLLGDKPTIFRVRNPLGARPGERVVIGLEQSALTQAAMAAYLVPVGALIGGAVLLQGLAERLGLHTELLAILGGAAGLAISLFWLRRHGRRLRDDQRFQAVILRRTDAAVVHFDPR
jgi:sigma-E factor negative regulatory protein RseC